MGHLTAPLRSHVIEFIFPLKCYLPCAKYYSDGNNSDNDNLILSKSFLTSFKQLLELGSKKIKRYSRSQSWCVGTGKTKPELPSSNSHLLILVESKVCHFYYV